MKICVGCSQCSCVNCMSFKHCKERLHPVNCPKRKCRFSAMCHRAYGFGRADTVTELANDLYSLSTHPRTDEKKASVWLYSIYLQLLRVLRGGRG